MMSLSFAEFKALSRKGNVIPVYREILADLETPVSAFLKIKKGPYAYLLESVESQENVGRYSFLASGPRWVFQSKDRRVTVRHFDRSQKKTQSYLCQGSPMDELRRLLSDFQFVSVNGLPRFCGGLVGYIGYDMVRFFEEIPDSLPDDLGAPDCVLMFSDTIVIFDHVNRKIKVVANALLTKKDESYLRSAYQECVGRIEDLLKDLRKPLRKGSELELVDRPLKVKSNTSKQAFMSAVLRAKEYIKQGDIIQVVLSQRLSVQCDRDPVDVYRALRSVNPSPYMFYLKLNEMALIGSSPELLVRCENSLVETRPIAGTRPRGSDEEQDMRLEKELKADVKEKAEHLMLVDLGRNDIGRVCQYGSVKVDEFMSVERYSHVMHLVSNVTGRLRTDKDALDALVSCFPAGTVSGAPKIRAMEIIDELEKTRRGPYAGAVCYFSFSGNLDSCIIIRTIVAQKGIFYIQAGAGIVSDSDPEREYQETMNKAGAMIAAIRQVS